jgi:hypothetical protein
MMNWVNLALFALAAVTTTVAPADGRVSQKHTQPVRVYVFTTQSSGGAVSEEEQGRLDSVRDLSGALNRSQFTLVAAADQAQMTVEVVNREERDASQGGFGGKSLTKFRETILRLRVKAGEDQSELKGIGRPSWGAAAKDAAKQLSSWAKNHRLGEPGAGGEERWGSGGAKPPGLIQTPAPDLRLLSAAPVAPAGAPIAAPSQHLSRNTESPNSCVRYP